jgi:hypothetical protein
VICYFIEQFSIECTGRANVLPQRTQRRTRKERREISSALGVFFFASFAVNLPYSQRQFALFRS